MTRFSDFVYKRPNFGQVESQFNSLLHSFQQASSVEKQSSTLSHINQLRIDYQTMFSIANTKYNTDTSNKKYEAEQKFADEQAPFFAKFPHAYYEALLNSKFKNELEHQLGTHLFTLANLRLQTFNPSIIEQLKAENRLCSKYKTLLASAEIPFEGKERNLGGFGPFLTSSNRVMRKKAAKTYFHFFEKKKETLDELFDNLVKVRHKTATKLGFKNFVELGYARMYRSDYDSVMIANYREQVRKYVVPLATEIRQQQQERLGLDKLYYSDEAVLFKTGNPTPKGDPAWIIANAEKMYSELSPETKDFFQFMKQNELMDLVNRKGKALGGYCTIFGKYKSPFIFSNFNGTSHDIRVLTHEAGHAFQFFSSRKNGLPEYIVPTMETAEIHSMAMEFLTWPWMHLFFQEDVTKFKYAHLAQAILFLPYGVAIDEFQHYVYENPDATPVMRNKFWQELEEKYLPHRQYENNPYLESGRFWQRQRHVYQRPFYYIDYTLAQVCALQFWLRAQTDRQAAFQDYLHICQLGGKLPFLDVVKEGSLTSPFEDGCLRKVMTAVKTWLDKSDQRNF